ncbi:hypothetical protein SDC9_166775 [bioreactor metagenome]|uniref:Uncharacterized protein n=1 Tax=bioreactor metagenome TaxID=1076179 RepID=A0A645FZR7_9ZZZZ
MALADEVQLVVKALSVIFSAGKTMKSSVDSADKLMATADIPSDVIVNTAFSIPMDSASNRTRISMPASAATLLTVVVGNEKPAALTPLKASVKSPFRLTPFTRSGVVACFPKTTFPKSIFDPDEGNER